MPAEQDPHAWPLLQQNDCKSSTNRRRAPPTPLILSISNVVPQHCSIKKIERRRRERMEIGSPRLSLRSPMQERERERGRTRSPRTITATLGLASPGEMFILYEPKHYQIKKCPPPKIPEGAAAPPVERRASNDTDSVAVDLVRASSLQRRATVVSPASRYSGSTAEGSEGSLASSSTDSSIPSSTVSSIPSSDTVILLGDRAAYIQLPSLPAPCAGPSTHRIQVKHKGGSVWRRM